MLKNNLSGYKSISDCQVAQPDRLYKQIIHFYKKPGKFLCFMHFVNVRYRSQALQMPSCVLKI